MKLLKRNIAMLLALMLCLSASAYAATPQEQSASVGLMMRRVGAAEFDRLGSFGKTGYAAAERDGRYAPVGTDGRCVTGFEYVWMDTLAAGEPDAELVAVAAKPLYTVTVYAPDGEREDMLCRLVAIWRDGREMVFEARQRFGDGTEISEPFTALLGELPEISVSCSDGVVRIGGRAFLLETGEEILPDAGDVMTKLARDPSLPFDRFVVTGDAADGLIPVRAENGVGGFQCFLMEKSGRIVRVYPGSVSADAIGGIDAVTDGAVVARSAADGDKTGLVGLLDESGNWVIEPQFEEYESGEDGVFSCGLWAVKKDGLWGAVDGTGSTVIPFEYESISVFSDGCAAAQFGGEPVIVTDGGERVELPGECGNVAWLGEPEGGFVPAYSAEGELVCCIAPTGGEPEVVACPDGVFAEPGSAAAYRSGERWGVACAVLGELYTAEFDDVEAGAYYERAAAWAEANGIAKGTADGVFSPDEMCTHAQIVTFIYRAQEPVVAAEIDGYAAAESWARENGVVNGDFDPDALCTRADAAQYLYRAAGSPEPWRGCVFGDVPDGYADAVSWAYSCGIAEGTADGVFSPDGVCTRAQIITFVYRAYA